MVGGRIITADFPITRARREVDRVLDDVFGNVFGGRGGFSPRLAVRTRHDPALNAWESEEGFHVEAEVPGLKLEELEILVEGNQLVVKGERKVELEEGMEFHVRERRSGEFANTLTLPAEIDAEKVEAHLENGVLTVNLPKAEAARPRRIEVKAR